MVEEVTPHPSYTVSKLQQKNNTHQIHQIFTNSSILLLNEMSSLGCRHTINTTTELPYLRTFILALTVYQ
jgi:hypothetical protein